MITALLLLSAVSAQPALPSWEQGLKNERALLREEKRALETELEQSRKNTASTAKAYEQQLKTLTEQLARRRAENESHRDSFVRREQNRSQSRSAEILGDLLARLQVWGKSRSLLRAEQMPSSNARLLPKDVVPTLEALTSALRQNAVVTTRVEKVFDERGVGHQSTIVHTGKVGAIEIENEGTIARPVEPVFGAQGYTHVAPPQSITTMGRKATVPVVLFDPDAPHDHAPVQSRGFLGWLEAGGLAMYPLFLMGLIALLVVMERAWRLLLAQRLWWKVPAELTSTTAVVPLLQAHASAPPLRPLRVLVSQDEATAEQLEERAVEAILRFRTRLRTRLSVLGVIAAAAPLLGLLGTVTGMIGTFRVITEHGTGDPELLSDGISQALLTTQLGLAIAIPTLLCHAGLGRWVQRLVGRAERAAMDLVRLQAEPGASVADEGAADVEGNA